jgi:hypothetical protein
LGRELFRLSCIHAPDHSHPLKRDAAWSISNPATSNTFRELLWPLNTSTFLSGTPKIRATSSISWQLAFPLWGSWVSFASRDFLQGLKPDGTSTTDDPGTTSSRMVSPWG